MPLRCQRLSIFLAASLLAAAGACSSSTAPSDRSLEGPWTTGHSLSGLDAGFDLSWAADLTPARTSTVRLSRPTAPRAPGN